MSAPDVAALLADADATVAQLANVCEQSYEPWITDSGTDLYPDEVSLHIEMLATALRAALADQRRWQYFTRSGLGAPSFAITLTLRPNVETIRAAIDAAMTADGGGV